MIQSLSNSWYVYCVPREGANEAVQTAKFVCNTAFCLFGGRISSCISHGCLMGFMRAVWSMNVLPSMVMGMVMTTMLSTLTAVS